MYPLIWFFRRGLFVLNGFVLGIAGMSYALPVSRAAEVSGGFLLVQQEQAVTQVKPGQGDEVLFQSQQPHEAIEWAMTHSSITVVTEGTYTLSAHISIPHPNVSLVIAENAKLVTAKGAKVINVTEKHGNYYPLIHNAGHNHVNVINLGTLNPSAHLPHDGQVNNVCIIYDGRNGGDNGIEGGMIFSSGQLLTDGDAVWIVDSKNVRVPLIWCRSTGNTLAIEGSDDLSIGTVAELNIEGRPTGKGRKGNEAIDLNSFCRRIHCDLAIGTAVMEETVDINNSPNCTFEDVRAYGRGRTFRERVYSPTGRRLTQKAYIDHSDGTIVKKEENDRSKILKAWETEFKVQDLLANLPVITVKAKLTAIFENSPKEELLNKTYTLDLTVK